MYLANQAVGEYQVGRGFLYENISKGDDSVINEHINIPRRSTTGILCFFTEYFVPERDSEKFVNPKITSVNFNFHGMPNKLY